MRTLNFAIRNSLVLSCLVTCLLPSVVSADKLRRSNVDDFARAYRVQVYESFHNNRDEYELRIAKGKEALGTYKTLKSPAKKQAIIGWFQLALDASRPGANSPLPNIPNLNFFGKNEQIAGQPSIPNSAATHRDRKRDTPVRVANRPQTPTRNAEPPKPKSNNRSLRGMSNMLREFVTDSLTPSTRTKPPVDEQQLTIVEPPPKSDSEPSQAEITREEDLMEFEQLMEVGDDAEVAEAEATPEQLVVTEELNQPTEASPTRAERQHTREKVDQTLDNWVIDEGADTNNDVADPQTEPEVTAFAPENNEPRTHPVAEREVVAADQELAVAVDSEKGAEPGSFPGVLEANARIAGHNLALKALRTRTISAFGESPELIKEIAPRLNSLLDTNSQLQAMIVMATENDRPQLIEVDPIGEFAAEFATQLRNFPTDQTGLSNADKLNYLRRIESFVNSK